jgi:hypothetical protein
MMRSLRAALLFYTALLPPPFAVVAVQVKGSGSFTNGAEIMSDGILPAQSIPWDSASCVHWKDRSATFVIDIEKTGIVRDMTLQVSGDDLYLIEASMDGVSFREILRILPEYGGKAPEMDTMSTSGESIHFMKEIDIDPFQARYLRITASGGDGKYAVSEVMADLVEIPFAVSAMRVLSLAGIDLAGTWHCRTTIRSGMMVQPLPNREMSVVRSGDGVYAGRYSDQTGSAEIGLKLTLDDHTVILVLRQTSGDSSLEAVFVMKDPNQFAGTWRDSEGNSGDYILRRK